VAEKVCGGKEGYVLEAGWPSAAYPNGKVVASPEDQKTVVTSYEENAPGHVAYFAYGNDRWKSVSSRTLAAPRSCKALWCSSGGSRMEAVVFGRVRARGFVPEM